VAAAWTLSSLLLSIAARSLPIHEPNTDLPALGSSNASSRAYDPAMHAVVSRVMPHADGQPERAIAEVVLTYQRSPGA